MMRQFRQSRVRLVQPEVAPFTTKEKSSTPNVRSATGKRDNGGKQKDSPNVKMFLRGSLSVSVEVDGFVKRHGLCKFDICQQFNMMQNLISKIENNVRLYGHFQKTMQQSL